MSLLRFLLAEPPQNNEEEPEDANEGLSGDLVFAGNAFPFGPAHPDDIANLHAHILQQLPPQEKAYQLVDLYFERAAWL